MAEPRVPGAGESLDLPCGESVSVRDLDMGMREYACACGEIHAVVTDVHPPTRFLPDFLVETLRESIDVADSFGEFGTPHLMGLVMEEFPDEVATKDVSDDGQVGYAVVWVADFDARRLHEVIVELIVELMEHAVSHADDDSMSEFETQMLEFDVAEFVEQYRAQRDLSADDVPGYERG